MILAIHTRVGISDAERITGLHRQTIWRRCRSGTFPAPHYIANRRMWFLDELEAWIAAEVARPRRGAANLHPDSRFQSGEPR